MDHPRCLYRALSIKDFSDSYGQGTEIGECVIRDPMVVTGAEYRLERLGPGKSTFGSVIGKIYDRGRIPDTTVY